MRVHNRIQRHHPEISSADVAWAWENYHFSASYAAFDRELRAGFDLKGRELEMIGVLMDGDWLVYRAFTPPTRKFRQEIERLIRRL